MGLIYGLIAIVCDLSIVSFLVAFAAPGHPLADTPTLSDEQLLELTWVVRERGSGTRQTF